MAQPQIKDQIRESQQFIGRTVVAAVLVLMLLGMLIGRLVYLQIIAHEHFTTLSRDNRVKLVPVPPTRGLIYDRNGVLLAGNRPAYSLEITPERVKDLDATLAGLAEVVAISDEDRERFDKLRRRQRRFESIPIRLQLEPEEAAAFAVQRHRFPGVDIAARLLRYYPLGAETAHVLGYVGRISRRDLEQIDQSQYAGTTHIGKIGIEKTYEDSLHGEVGLERVEVNALGRTVRVLERQPPVPGKDLRLNLDIRLQEAALAAFEGQRGALVAIDPHDGGVLAMVSKPGFDPNLFVEGISVAAYRALQKDIDKPLYNRALRGQYPPGSTVKPFIGLGGLESGTIGANTVHYCPGFYQLPNHDHKYRDWKKTGHGPMDLDGAITQSCDVFFYRMSHDMGIDQLSPFLAQFGFGARTGIDLLGELPGLLPSREWKRAKRNQPWYPGETLIMGIGQGYFLTTPLQLAAATAAFADGSVFHAPRLGMQLLDKSTGVTEPLLADTRPLTVQDRANWDLVARSMVHVVEGERGTARRILTDAYRIAGKTGTAQVFSVGQDEEYDEETVAERMRDHALFVAYAPVEEPRIAVAVIVENGGHGSSVAAPIARRVMDVYLQQEQP
jgi:penicillin-binding protein 2